MRIAIAAAVTCLSIVGMTATAQVHAAIRKHTEIPAESLDLALRTLAKDRGFQLVYLTENVAALQTHGAIGDFTVDEALKKLLSDSRLEYKFVDEITVSIFPKTDRTSALGRDRMRASGSDQNASGSASKRTSGEQIHLAQLDQGKTASDVSPVKDADQSTAGKLTEIVVSAQKRGNERLQDTPIPISVLSPNALTANNQVLLRDYYVSVPGLSVSPDIESQQEIAIRGITQSGGNPTVGVLVDDVPYGSSTNTGGNTVPDIDPGDLERIEVLRGPQGTLYGVNSMGGLVRYVTKDPSTDGYSGRLEAGTSHVYNGAEPGYNLRASVNVPLSDTWAIRASGFTRHDPGYIDNTFQHILGINSADAYGARLSSLWQPSDVFSLKLSGLYQSTRGNGISEVDRPINGYRPPVGYVGPPLGDLQQSYVAGADRSNIVNEALTAVAKAKLGSVTLTSDTGYSINRATTPFDFSYAFGRLFVALGYGVSGAPLVTNVNVHKFTQELRVEGNIGSNIDWLVGGYYGHETESPSFHQTIYEADSTTGQPVGVFYDAHTQDTFEEYAGFGNLTYHFTEQFDVQLGARESHNHQDFNSITTGPFVGLVYPTLFSPLHEGASETGNSFTYLLTPRFKLSEDLMLYVRLASGYRPGGPNPVPVPGVPPSFGPDKTLNYEVGVKGDFLDRKLSVDASVYYIDWRDLLVQNKNVYGFEENGSRAKSEGIELAVRSQPLTGLALSGWIDYDNAVLTADFPVGSAARGVSGDRLPNTPRFSANLSAEETFPLTAKMDGFMGATAAYIGEREGFFVPGPQRTTLPSYTRTDLRTGVRYDDWTVNVYANNVADVRGATSGGLGYYIPWAFNVIQPRTIGLSVSKTFH